MHVVRRPAGVASVRGLVLRVRAVRRRCRPAQAPPARQAALGLAGWRAPTRCPVPRHAGAGANLSGDVKLISPSLLCLAAEPARSQPSTYMLDVDSCVLWRTDNFTRCRSHQRAAAEPSEMATAPRDRPCDRICRRRLLLSGSPSAYPAVPRSPATSRRLLNPRHLASRLSTDLSLGRRVSNFRAPLPWPFAVPVHAHQAPCGPDVANGGVDRRCGRVALVERRWWRVQHRLWRPPRRPRLPARFPPLAAAAGRERPLGGLERWQSRAQHPCRATGCRRVGREAAARRLWRLGRRTRRGPSGDRWAGGGRRESPLLGEVTWPATSGCCSGPRLQTHTCPGGRVTKPQKRACPLFSWIVR